MKTLTIIDTFGFLFRSYYALPPLRSRNGFPTGLLTGFMNFILNIGKDFQTDYLVFALDSKGDTFRNELYSQYKSHRPDVPEDLLKQLPIAIEFIEKMGFKTASCVGFEADDIIASLAIDAKKMGLMVQIISHDKDLYQLIDDGSIYLFDPQKKEKVDSSKCFEKYGVYPNQFIDYQALLGDSADNIPGVKGVGKKTAEALISQYGTLDNIYANLSTIPSKRWAALLEENKEMAYLSRTLVTLKTDAHIIDDLENFHLPSQNPILKITNELQEYDLSNVIKKVNEIGLAFKTQLPQGLIIKQEPQNKTAKFILIDDDEKLQNIKNLIKPDSIIAFDTETNSLDAKTTLIVGFSFCFDESTSYYVPINHHYLGVGTQVSKQVAKDFLIFLNGHRLVFQNYKFDSVVVLSKFDLKLNIFSDTMILAWLLDSSSQVGLDFLSKKYFYHDMIGFNDVVKKGETFASLDLNKACEYAAEDAWMTYKLYFKLVELLNVSDPNLLLLASDMEFRFIEVILEMEINGIKIDIEYLKKIQLTNQEQLDILTNQIYSLCGSKFNINSTKQLGTILFEQLKLPADKKTKTGYSTDEQALQAISHTHEVIPKLLDYRELFKLKSTYIEPLLEYAQNDKNNRVYTSFLQTGTATGRLSSKNPNLQNIPVKSELGREIRNAFVADEGKVFLGIDYSQIELRLLAHFCKDEALVDAFQKGLDIHTQTAVKLFGENEAKAKRNIAKSINFGLIYGMGAKKLSLTLGISPKEAKSYIDSYFALFPTIKNYLQSLEDFVQRNGFVYTLLGHKRVFDFANANGILKAAYIREGVNTVFQGSAADIIKLSMIEIFKEFKDDENIKMLLQIHDELIFEIANDKVEFYKNKISEIMKNIITLEVPLEVSANIAKSWGELK